MKVKCNNCDWEGDDSDDGFTELGLCSDLYERLAPGEEIPAGDCPECRAFCYIVREEVEDQDDDADLLSMKTDLDYAIGQLRLAVQQKKTAIYADCTQRALDALERIESAVNS